MTTNELAQRLYERYVAAHSELWPRAEMVPWSRLHVRLQAVWIAVAEYTVELTGVDAERSRRLVEVSEAALRRFDLIEHPSDIDRRIRDELRDALAEYKGATDVNRNKQ